jgi:hypothetical protein
MSDHGRSLLPVVTALLVATTMQRSTQPEESGKVIKGRFPDPPPDTYDVFVSYCERDQPYWDQIETHLRPMCRRYGVKVYSYDMIEPGAVIRDEARSALTTSVVTVLLISKHYLASDLLERELLDLLEQTERGTRILRLQVGTCDLSDWDMLTKYQQVGAGKPPLDRLREPRKDEIYVELLEAIRRRLKECGRIKRP